MIIHSLFDDGSNGGEVRLASMGKLYVASQCSACNCGHFSAAAADQLVEWQTVQEFEVIRHEEGWPRRNNI